MESYALIWTGPHHFDPIINGKRTRQKFSDLSLICLLPFSLLQDTDKAISPLHFSVSLIMSNFVKQIWLLVNGNS